MRLCSGVSFCVSAEGCSGGCGDVTWFWVVTDEVLEQAASASSASAARPRQPVLSACLNVVPTIRNLICDLDLLRRAGLDPGPAALLDMTAYPNSAARKFP